MNKIYIIVVFMLGLTPAFSQHKSEWGTSRHDKNVAFVCPQLKQCMEAARCLCEANNDAWGIKIKLHEYNSRGLGAPELELYCFDIDSIEDLDDGNVDGYPLYDEEGRPTSYVLIYDPNAKEWQARHWQKGVTYPVFPRNISGDLR